MYSRRAMEVIQQCSELHGTMAIAGNDIDVMEVHPLPDRKSQKCSELHDTMDVDGNDIDVMELHPLPDRKCQQCSELHGTMDVAGNDIDVMEVHPLPDRKSQQCSELHGTMDVAGNGIDAMEVHPLPDRKLSVTEGITTYPMTKPRVIKNLAVISVAFVFLFTAFMSLQNLQSSLNQVEGLGTVGLTVLYATGIVTGLFLPSVMIDRLGCKWTMAASMVCYMVYMGANLHATWAIIIPAAVVIGVGAAPLWAAHSTYLTQTAVWYAALTGTTKEATISRFFGIFFMAFQTSQIWGNLIASLVFRHHDNNVTDQAGAASLETCGAAFCPTSYTNNTNLDRPDMNKIYTVCGIYLGCALVGLLLIVGLVDQIPLAREQEGPSVVAERKVGTQEGPSVVAERKVGTQEGPSVVAARKVGTQEGPSVVAERKVGKSLHPLTDTIRHVWTSRYQQLLIPITVYNGLEQAFIAGEFTQSYISCAIGIWNVGFVMIAFGATNSVCSLVFGRLVKFVGHSPLFLLAFVVHGGAQVTMLVWSPTPDSVLAFYILAVLWGVGDAVVNSQLNAVYGCLFTDNPESAFASFRFFDWLGYIIAFGISSVLCTDMKLSICLGVLVLGMALYAAVDISERRRIASDARI